jgi:dTDP-4-dehydrorhamnose reductase
MDSTENVRVLVLGASGMLGNAVLRFFSESLGFDVKGSVRSASALAFLPKTLHEHIVCGVDVENTDSLTALFAQVRPSVVINCIGLVKQLAQANDPLSAIPINSLLPHRLARLCDLTQARLIHISTDCVFSGASGGYREHDLPDAQDLYGRSKYLGEVSYPNAITLRTSIIGHELGSAHALIGWFLSQQDEVRGYTRAIFSGLPTVELAEIIRDKVIPNSTLHGLYHVSSAPINKHDLLKLVAEIYGKSIQVLPDDSLIIDRSLDSSRFAEACGYHAPSWSELVKKMRDFA